MERLEKEIRRVGQTFTQIDRTDIKAIYKSSYGHYEVFRIKTAKDSIVFGKEVKAHEKYPSNEDFGISAWSVSSEKRAFEIYNSITKIEKPNNK
jgi:hypothetical protein